MSNKINNTLVDQLIDLRDTYVETYKDEPHCFLVSPHDYLSLVTFFVSTQYGNIWDCFNLPNCFNLPIRFHGLPVLLKFSGSPEVGPNLKNVKQIAYEQVHGTD